MINIAPVIKAGTMGGKNDIESHAPKRPERLPPNTSLVIISYIEAPAASIAAQDLMPQHHM